MREMQLTSRTTFVFCSHDPQLIERADVKVQIEDGEVIDVTREPHLRVSKQVV